MNMAWRSAFRFSVRACTRHVSFRSAGPCGALSVPTLDRCSEHRAGTTQTEWTSDSIGTAGFAPTAKEPRLDGTALLFARTPANVAVPVDPTSFGKPRRLLIWIRDQNPWRSHAA